jgi:succinyl-diaminopimelate desuccinylase
MPNNKTLDLVQRLIARPSVTPNDAGCQDIIRQELGSLGFKFVDMTFGETKNLWASRGTGAPHFVFAGHTDVVPPGDTNSWTNDPFEPTIRDGKLYGRGVADMKGGIAAMIVAVQELIAKNPDLPGTISFLITSDEEGPGHDGTKRALEQLKQDNIHVDWCIVGEPVSQKILGDTMKLGSRGSLHGELIFTGKQGHVGHAQRAVNPVHVTMSALLTLTQIEWDKETTDFPATSFQITRLHSDSGAVNVIPETLTCRFNLRFSPSVAPDEIKARITEVLKTKQSLPYTEKWSISGVPYLSKRGRLTEVAREVVRQAINQEPEIRSVGGTSDARFIVPALECETLELGLMDTTMHEVNEHVACDDLEKLTVIYGQVLERLFLGKVDIQHNDQKQKLDLTI